MVPQTPLKMIPEHQPGVAPKQNKNFYTNRLKIPELEKGYQKSYRNSQQWKK